MTPDVKKDPKVTVSVVLAAYNGEKYIVEQLDSLRNQTHAPDCVTIVDDCSSDRTVSIVARYIRENQLAPAWRLKVNSSNIGWKRNFYDALHEVETTYVFPCDQDDIWDASKLEVMTRAMVSDPRIDLLACLVEPFYEPGAEAYLAARGESGLPPEQCVHPVPLDSGSDFVYTRRPGCTYGIRMQFIREISPWWDPKNSHDGTLWRHAAFKGSLRVLDKELVRFRRHQSSASARGWVTRDIRIDELECFIGYFADIRGHLTSIGALTDCKSALLSELESWFLARLRLLEKRRLGLLPEIVRNMRFYSTRWSLPVDFALAVLPNARLRP